MYINGKDHLKNNNEPFSVQQWHWSCEISFKLTGLLILPVQSYICRELDESWRSSFKGSICSFFFNKQE